MKLFLLVLWVASCAGEMQTHWNLQREATVTVFELCIFSIVSSYFLMLVGLGTMVTFGVLSHGFMEQLISLLLTKIHLTYN